MNKSKSIEILIPKGKDLIQALCEFNDCKIYSLKKNIVKNFDKNLEFLKSIKLRTTHLKMNIIIPADGLTLRGAETLFALRGFKNVTVEDYYRIKHGIELQSLKLPCIVMQGGGDHLSFYPLEVLEVVEKI